MKKTLITLLALAGVTTADTILTFTGNNVGGVNYTAPSWSIDSCDAHAKNSGITLKLQDETSFTLTWTVGGQTYISPDTVEWANTSALTEMNNVLGTTLTNGDVSAITKTCFGNNVTGDSVLTLNLGDSSYSAGDGFTAYLILGQYGSSLNSFTVAGLDNTTISYATATGVGFSSDAAFSGAGAATLVKVTGNLTDDSVVFTTNGHKVGYGMLATKYDVIPEPTTATLSLLALAGLAARRRRK